jgi:hypothetical protein
MKPALLVFATLASFIGTADYVLSILRGKTRPHKTTRVVSLANLVGSIAVHAALGILLLAIIFFIRSLVLAVLSLKYGVGGRSRLDIVCGVMAIVGITAWLVTGNGITALVFAIVADGVAYAPAIVKTWKLPKSEAPLLYWLESVAAMLAIIHDGFRLSVIFQAYVIVSCAVMLICIYRPTS